MNREEIRQGAEVLQSWTVDGCRICTAIRLFLQELVEAEANDLARFVPVMDRLSTLHTDHVLRKHPELSKGELP